MRKIMLAMLAVVLIAGGFATSVAAEHYHPVGTEKFSLSSSGIVRTIGQVDEELSTGPVAVGPFCSPYYVVDEDGNNDGVACKP